MSIAHKTIRKNINLVLVYYVGLTLIVYNVSNVRRMCRSIQNKQKK